MRLLRAAVPPAPPSLGAPAEDGRDEDGRDEATPRSPDPDVLAVSGILLRPVPPATCVEAPGCVCGVVGVGVPSSEA